MAVWTSALLTFEDLYGTNGLGFLVGDTSSGSVNDRKNAVLWAYIELFGQIKGYWRKRSSTYTSSSSPALTAGTSTYNWPSDYDAPFRIYYREAGRVQDVEILGDSEWLERSATRSTDAGDPQFARVIHNGTAFRFELDKPVSQAFIDRIGTLSVEYFIGLTLMSADGDQPIGPQNTAVLLLPVAAYKYAIGQGDTTLANQFKADAALAKSKVLKYDLTRTGRPRRMRPRNSYAARGVGSGLTDYGEV